MGDDAVGHGVGGDVRCVVTYVGNMGGRLRLIVTECEASVWWCRRYPAHELWIGVDDALRIAVCLRTAIADDPGWAG